MKRAAILALCLTVSAVATAAATVSPPSDRGEYVARLANCVACHSIADAPAFSGGLKMATPLGAIYTTNITPDPETGIGKYTLEDFDRAVRLGIAKDGHRLYPAMPYPSYVKMNAEDIAALYGFFMKAVPAAQVPNKASEIKAPWDARWPMAIWNFLFTSSEPYQAKPEHDAVWNRGAYIVQGPGHCGACHTPRGFTFDEKGYDESTGKFLSGAPLDSWSASNLRSDPDDGLGRWSQDNLAGFLKNGHNGFGTAFGTMTEVINNSTQYMAGEDITAVTVYLRSLKGRDTGKPAFAYDPLTARKLDNREFDLPGALIYTQQCMACHYADGQGSAPYLAPLAGNAVILDRDPVSLINIVLNGSSPVVLDGMPDAYRMPHYRVSLGDQDIADVLSFVRRGWGNKAGPVSAAEVAEVRKSTDVANAQVQILRMK